MKNVKSLVIICSVILFTGIILSALSYEEMGRLNSETIERQNNIKQIKWLFIKGIIQENMDKSKIQAHEIATVIENDVKNEYSNDTERLQYDLSHPRNSSQLNKIVNKRIENVYLNIKTDDNDPFVAMTWGIIADRSLNCAVFGRETRLWEEEYMFHCNKELAKSTVNLILDQSPSLKFWEFKNPSNENHEVLTYPTWDGLEHVYLTEGLDGLDSYEILVPVYIYSYSDMVGIKDVDNSGIRQKNYKLIIVQGFNIIDALNTKHLEKLNYLDYQEKMILRLAEDNKRQEGMKLLLVIPLLSLTFIFASFALNKSLGGDRDANGEGSTP